MIRRLVAWVVLSAMPFHALTGIYLDLHGPAHFHLHAHTDDDHDDDHRHGQVERHRHAAHDASVVNVADDAASDVHSAEEGVAPGWSATMGVALLSSLRLPHLPDAAGGVVPGRDPLLRTRVPGCPEPPPRLVIA